MPVQLSGKQGFALIEAMIALGLFSIAVISLWTLVFQTQDFVQNTSLRLNAVVRAYEHVETVVLNSFSSSFEPPASSTISYITPCLARLTERETWQSLRTHSISASGFITDLLEVKNRGRDCGGYPNNYQMSGVTSTSAFSTQLPAGSQATGVDIVGKNVLLSLIATDPISPDLLSATIVTDAAGSHLADERTLDVGGGLNSIDGVGGFVYGARKDTTKQFVVVDARQATTAGLSLIASSTLPGVTGAHPEGFSIFYYESRVYVGTKRTAGHEFHIFDVSDPYNPVWLGSREVNHNINDIVVWREGQQTLAFLATSGNTKDLIVLDVSQPSIIAEVNSLDLPGGEDGRSLALMGHTLFLGRFKSVTNNPDFYAISLDTNSVIGSYTVSADINAIRIAHDYAFLATAKPSRPFVVLNIASSTHMFIASDASATAKITALDYQDNIFVAAVFGGEHALLITPQP